MFFTTESVQEANTQVYVYRQVRPSASKSVWSSQLSPDECLIKEINLNQSMSTAKRLIEDENFEGCVSHSADHSLKEIISQTD